jgi:hypothetical protein
MAWRSFHGDADEHQDQSGTPGSAKHGNKLQDWALPELILALMTEINWPFSDVVSGRSPQIDTPA